MHEEPGLDSPKCLAETNGCVLSYYYCGNCRIVLRLVAKHLRLVLKLILLFLRQLQLLLLDPLLKVAGGEALNVVDYYVFRLLDCIHHYNLTNFLDLGQVALLLLYSIAEIVRSLLKHQLRPSGWSHARRNRTVEFWVVNRVSQWPNFRFSFLHISTFLRLSLDILIFGSEFGQVVHVYRRCITLPILRFPEVVILLVYLGGLAKLLTVFHSFILSLMRARAPSFFNFFNFSLSRQPLRHLEAAPPFLLDLKLERWVDGLLGLLVFNILDLRLELQREPLLVIILMLIHIY